MSHDKPHVLISGGGIGGMAAALSLLRLGFDVDVYEQAQELREVGAGVQISPNGTRALNWLGVLPELQKLSVKTDAKEIKLWNTGQTWTLFDLGREAIQRYGFPYVTVYRPDLLQVLADAARRLKPDVLRTGRRSVGVSQYDERVALHLDGGEAVSGDAVIGADGVHSTVRASLLGADKARFSGMTAWRGTIPMERLPADYRRSVAVNWVGPGGHVVHYPLRGGTLMNFVGIHERQDWQIESLEHPRHAGGMRRRLRRLASRDPYHHRERAEPVQMGADVAAAPGPVDARPHHFTRRRLSFDLAAARPGRGDGDRGCRDPRPLYGAMARRHPDRAQALRAGAHRHHREKGPERRRPGLSLPQ